jgi:DNA-binding CsgD family transcriptional regulator
MWQGERAEDALPGMPGGSSLLSEGAWGSIQRSFHFSDRERQIVKGLFDDATESLIGDELGISPHTVHTHVERLYRKAGVTSRVQLVVRVFAEYLRIFASDDGPRAPPRTPRPVP